GGTPGDRIPFREGYLELADDEAWLVADADEATTSAAGYGARSTPTDSGQSPWSCSLGAYGSATGRRGGSAPSAGRTIGCWTHRIHADSVPSGLGRPLECFRTWGPCTV